MNIPPEQAEPTGPQLPCIYLCVSVLSLFLWHTGQVYRTRPFGHSWLITYPGLCTKAVCLFEAKQFMFSPWKKMEAHKWKGRRKQLTVATNLFWIPEQQEWREQAGRAAESLPGWPEEVVVHQITTQIPKGFRTSCTVIALLLHAPNLFTMWPHYVTFLMSPSERPLWQSIS